MVEVGKAKEGMDFLNLSRGWPCGDAIKFDQVHDELTRYYNHSKVFNFWDIELTFLKLQMEVKFGHSLENMTSLLSVSFWVRGGDEEVVHVDD